MAGMADPVTARALAAIRELRDSISLGYPEPGRNFRETLVSSPELAGPGEAGSEEAGIDPAYAAAMDTRRFD